MCSPNKAVLKNGPILKSKLTCCLNTLSILGAQDDASVAQWSLYRPLGIGLQLKKISIISVSISTTVNVIDVLFYVLVLSLILCEWHVLLLLKTYKIHTDPTLTISLLKHSDWAPCLQLLYPCSERSGQHTVWHAVSLVSIYITGAQQALHIHDSLNHYFS